MNTHSESSSPRKVDADQRQFIPNVLAERYASPEMIAIWSPTGRILLEREFWIAVLKAQQSLGLPIPDEAIRAYENVQNDVDLASIRRREAISRHDVKARIEEFCALAGHEEIHKGMTSRDLTENVEQLQVYRSLRLIARRAVAILQRFADRAEQYRDTLLSARTHNVAAQPTTLGKRIAMFGEEFLRAVQNLDRLLLDYPARGIKGAVGTQMDLLTLFAGDSDKVDALERTILEHLGLPASWHNVGQIYPRGLDFEAVNLLLDLASGPTGFATTLRLMAGHELAGEGFAKGQTGSSAMPHKMNARSCERVCGFKILLQGYAAMAATLAGNQWNEGDVSCSVVRRVVLPDSFFALDGLFETILTILDQLEVFPGAIDQENDRYFPFLLSTTVLMEAVRRGVGREAAHSAIKEHAIQTTKELRDGRITHNDFFDRLAKDARIGLDGDALAAIRDRASSLCGHARQQTDSFVQSARVRIAKNSDDSKYRPHPIL